MGKEGLKYKHAHRANYRYKHSKLSHWTSSHTSKKSTRAITHPHECAKGTGVSKRGLQLVAIVADYIGIYPVDS